MRLPRRRYTALAAVACLSGTPLPEAAHLGWGDREIVEDRGGETIAQTAFHEQGRYPSFRVVAINTGEVLDIDLDGDGAPTPEAAGRVAHLFRSLTPPGEIPIDARLIALLGRIAQKTGKPIELVSAYRAPTYAGESNFHTRGEAADIRIDGLETEELRLLAKTLGARGLGDYPVAKMVHVDLREKPYQWTDFSPPERAVDGPGAAGSP